MKVTLTVVHDSDNTHPPRASVELELRCNEVVVHVDDRELAVPLVEVLAATRLFEALMEAP